MAQLFVHPSFSPKNTGKGFGAPFYYFALGEKWVLGLKDTHFPWFWEAAAAKREETYSEIRITRTQYPRKRFLHKKCRCFCWHANEAATVKLLFFIKKFRKNVLYFSPSREKILAAPRLLFHFLLFHIHISFGDKKLFPIHLQIVGNPLLTSSLA